MAVSRLPLLTHGDCTKPEGPVRLKLNNPSNIIVLIVLAVLFLRYFCGVSPIFSCVFDCFHDSKAALLQSPCQVTMLSLKRRANLFQPRKLCSFAGGFTGHSNLYLADCLIGQGG
jgi:hypothetical protein